LRNLKLLLTYDGSRYRGWQRLKGTDNTIQGKLETALTRILDEPVELIASGRTDAGVHALGQVANFHCQSSMDCREILSELRRYLPGDIGVLSCEEASARFHARYNARRKTYLYRVWNSSAPCVFIRGQVYRLETPLNIDAMKEAAAHFLGTHDFRAFCTGKGSGKSTVRTIDALTVTRQGQEVQIRIRADGFLYNMVRIITGTLLEVGMADHPLTAGDIPGILETQTRSYAGYTVPAQGLTLVEVEY